MHTKPHLSEVWVETMPIVYRISEMDPNKVIPIIKNNLEKVKEIDKFETERDSNYLSIAHTTLQINLIEATIGLAEQDPSNFTRALEMLAALKQ